ncbi:MAG TPA: HAD-IA family hydrolase, partial [Polyangiaceae bacterium]|nr:HAD-IA family hydrolase [Polyangiaceae bacterium]
MLEFHPDSHDAVIFDCDGTLVDTMPLHHCAWQKSFEQFGAPFQFTWELFTRRAGMTLEQTVEELNREFGCELPVADVVAAQRAEYARGCVDVAPIPHVAQFARAVAANHPVAVASGSSRATVEDALSRVALLELFKTIVTPADVQRGKPAPDMFLLAAARLGVPPERCLVIEDGELGLQAARLAKMDAFKV